MQLISDPIRYFNNHVLELISTVPTYLTSTLWTEQTIDSHGACPLFFAESEEDLILAEYFKEKKIGLLFNLFSSESIEEDLEDNPVVKKEIEELLKSDLVFPFEVEVPKRYEIKAKYLDFILYIKNRYESKLSPLASIKCRGSKCPKMVGSKFFAEFLVRGLPGLQKIMTTCFGRHIDSNFSDIDTHIDAQYTNALLSADHKSIPEMMLDYLIHAHHCPLQFRITYEDDSSEEVLSFETLVQTLKEASQKPVKVKVLGDAIPWLKGKRIMDEPLQNFLIEIAKPIKSDYDTWINGLACPHLFNKSIEEMKAFITKKGNAFVHFHHEFRLASNGSTADKNLDRMTCRDGNGRVHDIIADYDTTHLSYRVEFQNMHLELIPALCGQKKLVLKTTAQAILDKACKLIRWVNLEKAVANDCTLLWALVVQGYRSVDDKTQPVLLEKFKAFCKSGNNFAETAADIISKDIDKRYKNNQIGAVMYTFYACQTMLEEGVSPAEIDRIWPLLKDVLIQKNQKSSLILGHIQIANALCNKTLDFKTVSSLLQVLGFRYKLLPGEELAKAKFKAVLTTHNRKPAIQFINNDETVIFPFKPDDAQRHLEEVYNELKLAGNYDALDALDKISAALGMPHDADHNQAFKKYTKETVKSLENPNPLIRRQAYAFLVMDHQLNPNIHSLIELLRHLPEYIALENNPEKLNGLASVFEKSIPLLFNDLNVKDGSVFIDSIKKLIQVGRHSSLDNYLSWCDLLAGSHQRHLYKLAVDLWKVHSPRAAQEQQRASGLSLFNKMRAGNFHLAGKLALMMLERGLFTFDDQLKTMQAFLDEWTADACSKEKDVEMRLQGLYMIGDLLKAYCTKSKPADYRSMAARAILAMLNANASSSFAFASICQEQQILPAVIKDALKFEEERAAEILTSLCEAYGQESGQELSELYLQLIYRVAQKMKDTSPEGQKSVENACFQLITQGMLHIPFEKLISIWGSFFQKEFILPTTYSAQQMLNYCALVLDQQPVSVKSAHTIWETGSQCYLWDHLDFTSNFHFILALIEKLHATEDKQCKQTADNILLRVSRIPALANDAQIRTYMSHLAKNNHIEQISSDTGFENPKANIDKLLALTDYTNASDVKESRQAVYSSLSRILGKEGAGKYSSVATELLENSLVALLFKDRIDEFLSLYILYLEYLLALDVSLVDDQTVCSLIKGVIEHVIKDENLSPERASKIVSLLDKFISRKGKAMLSEPLKKMLARHHSVILKKLKEGSCTREICRFSVCMAKSEIVTLPSTFVLDCTLEALYQHRAESEDRRTDIDLLLENWTIPNDNLNIGELKFLRKLIDQLLNAGNCSEAYNLFDKCLLSVHSVPVKCVDTQVYCLNCIASLSKAGKYDLALKLLLKLNLELPEARKRIFHALLEIPAESVRQPIIGYASLMLSCLNENSVEMNEETRKKIEAAVEVLLDFTPSKENEHETVSRLELAIQLLARCRSQKDSLWLKSLNMAAKTQSIKVLKLNWEQSQVHQGYTHFLSQEAGDSKEWERWRVYEAACLQVLASLFVESKEPAWCDALVEQFDNMLDEKRFRNKQFAAPAILTRRRTDFLTGLISRIEQGKLQTVPDNLLERMVKARGHLDESLKGTPFNEIHARFDMPLIRLSMSTNDINIFIAAAKSLHRIICKELHLFKAEQKHYDLLVSFANQSARFYARENPNTPSKAYQLNILGKKEDTIEEEKEKNEQNDTTHYLSLLCMNYQTEMHASFDALPLLEALAKHPSPEIVKKAHSIADAHLDKILPSRGKKSVSSTLAYAKNVFQALIKRMFEIDDDEFFLKAIVFFFKAPVKELFPQETYNVLAAELVLNGLRLFKSLNAERSDSFFQTGIQLYNANKHFYKATPEMKSRSLQLAFENIGQIFVHPKGMYVGEGMQPWGKKIWDILRLLQSTRFKPKEKQDPRLAAVSIPKRKAKSEAESSTISKKDLARWIQTCGGRLDGKIISPEQILKSTFHLFLDYLCQEFDLKQNLDLKWLDGYIETTVAEISAHFKDFFIVIEGTNEELFHYNVLLINKFLELRPTEPWAKSILMCYIFRRIVTFINNNQDRGDVILQVFEKFVFSPIPVAEGCMPLHTQFSVALYNDCIEDKIFDRNPQLRYQLHLMLKGKIDLNCTYLSGKKQVEAIENLIDKLLAQRLGFHQHLASRCLIEAQHQHKGMNSDVLARCYQKIVDDFIARPFYSTMASKTIQHVAAWAPRIDSIRFPIKTAGWCEASTRLWTTTFDALLTLIDHEPLEGSPYAEPADLIKLAIDFLGMGASLNCFAGQYKEFVTRVRRLFPKAVSRISPGQNNMRIIRSINMMLTEDCFDSVPKNHEERHLRATVTTEWLKILYDLKDPAGNGAIFSILQLPAIMDKIFNGFDELRNEAKSYSRILNPALIKKMMLEVAGEYIDP